jgi:hypothetical protein
MAEPNGKLVTPTGFNPSGVLRALELDAVDSLKVYVMGGTVTEVPHNLLDASANQDTLAGNPLQGDLIVGNATPKWARFPKGAALQVLRMNAGATNPEWAAPSASGIPAGAAFPGGPSSGDQFFRTDLGMFCYYDGTRWLTVNEFAGHVDAIISAAVSPTINVNRTRTDYAKWFTRISGSTWVQTTNDGTKYWTVLLRGANAPRGAFTTIWSFDTHLDTVGVFTQHESAPAVNNPANQVWFDVQVDKVSTPGTINVYVDFYYRLIVT